MEENIVLVTLDEFQGKILSGRDRGIEARNLKRIDAFDDSPQQVKINFPEGLWSVTSSFFLGMFGPSIIKFGSKEAFKSKYSFKSKDSILILIDGYIDFALQNRNII